MLCSKGYLSNIGSNQLPNISHYPEVDKLTDTVITYKFSSAVTVETCILSLPFRRAAEAVFYGCISCQIDFK